MLNKIFALFLLNHRNKKISLPVLNLNTMKKLVLVLASALFFGVATFAQTSQTTAPDKKKQAVKEQVTDHKDKHKDTKDLKNDKSQLKADKKSSASSKTIKKDKKNVVRDRVAKAKNQKDIKKDNKQDKKAIEKKAGTK